jgi:cytochrome o ubiquinol oxidase subunit 3
MAVNSENLSHPNSGNCPVASKVTFGFWIYVMTDAVMFATLFAVYVVLHNSTYGGPSIREVASLNSLLMQTLVFLVSAFLYGLSLVSFYRGNKPAVLSWLALSFVFGAIFLAIEWNDGASLVAQGYDWTKSAFLSSYFGFLGIHGLHVFIGLLWMVIVAVQFKYKGLTVTMNTRFVCLGLFWNFVNLMWLIAFTIMFLMGAV